MVVGTGAEPHLDGNGGALLSDRARRVVAEADKVLFLVADREVERWVRAAGREAESLAHFRLPTLALSEVYLDMSEWVLTYVRLGLHVVVLVYGRPDPAPPHVMAATVADRGYPAVMVPATDADAWRGRCD